MKKYATFEISEVMERPKAIFKDMDEDLFQIPEKEGMVYARVRAIASKINNNLDAFEREELERAWPTFIGRPVFVEHNNKNPEHARGLIIDAAYHDDHPDSWIELLLEVDAQAYPLLAEGLRKGRINKVSMGTNVKTSVCSVCGNEATNEKQFCEHIRNKGRTYRNAQGMETLAYEINRGLDFFEISFVISPAEEWADVLAVYGEQDDGKFKKLASGIRRPRENVGHWAERTSHHVGMRKVAGMRKTSEVYEVLVTYEGGQGDSVVTTEDNLEAQNVFDQKVEEAENYDYDTDDDYSVGIKEVIMLADGVTVDSWPEGIQGFASRKNKKVGGKDMKLYKTEDVIEPKVAQCCPHCGEKLSAMESVTVPDNWPQKIRSGPGKAPGGNMEGVEPVKNWPEPERTSPGSPPTPGSRQTVDVKNYKEKRPSRPTVGGVGREVPTTRSWEDKNWSSGANTKKQAQKMEEDNDISVPAPPTTIDTPEGDEVDRKSLQPIEDKEEKTVDALVDRLQKVLDDFKGEEKKEDEMAEEEEPENEPEPLPEENEELPPLDKDEGSLLASENSGLEKEAKDSDGGVAAVAPTYTCQLKAKRLVREMVKKAAISEDDVLDKEIEYAKLSETELDDRLSLLASIPDREEEGFLPKEASISKRRVPRLKTAIASDREPLITNVEMPSPSNLFM